MLKNYRLTALITIISASLVLLSCDAENDALKLFTQQGITLLLPARTYVRPGGLVVLVGKSTPLYMDPLDNPDPGGNSEDNNNETDFQAVFAAEAKSNSTTLKIAIQLISKIIPGAGAAIGSSDEVTLDSIESSGRRLFSGSLLDYIQRNKRTGAEIESRLSDSTRVFVVQEIYKAKALTLKSTHSASLGVQVASTLLPTCPTGTDPGQNATNPGTTAPATTEAASAAKPAPTSAPKTPATAPTKPVASNAPGTTDQTATKPATANGGSFSICMGPDKFSLNFKTNTELPFAVRLVEIYRNKDKVLDIKAGGAPVPGAMGPHNIGLVSARLHGSKLGTIKKVCPMTLPKGSCVEDVQ